MRKPKLNPKATTPFDISRFRLYANEVRKLTVLMSSTQPLMDQLMLLHQTEDINLFPELNSLKFSAVGHRTRRYLALFLSPSISKPVVRYIDLCRTYNGSSGMGIPPIYSLHKFVLRLCEII